jgi:O-antigen/teichoic acid export membrane protein
MSTGLPKLDSGPWSRFKRLLQPTEFRKNVLSLAMGTGAAQLIPILSAPLFSRIFSDSQYGLLAYFLTAGNVLGVIATGRYELAVMLPESNEDSHQLVGLSIGIALVVSILSFPIALLLGNALTPMVGEPDFRYWLLLLPAYVFLAGLYSALLYSQMRDKAFKRIAMGKLAQGVSVFVVTLALGIHGFGWKSLLIGAMAGQIAPPLALLVPYLRGNPGVTRAWHWSRMKPLAKKYANFPKANAAHALLDMLQDFGVNFLIGATFGTRTTGQYAWGQRMVRGPITILSTSLSQVFFQRATEAHNQGEPIEPLVKRAMSRMAWIGLPIFLLLLLAGPQTFAFVFGPQWRTAGEFMQILSPWIYMRLIFAPVASVALILGKQMVFLLIALVYNLGIVATFWAVSSTQGGVQMALIGVSVWSTAYLLYCVQWILRQSKQRLAV